MTFKEFVSGSLLLPARILNGTVSLLFGAAGRNKDGSIDEQASFPGFLGMVLGTVGFFLDLAKSAGRTITGLVRANQEAIATAFWMSLAVGSAAALTVAFWPAALATVVNFSIAGYSIASVFGADFAVQVGATAGLAALATNSAVYALSTAVNLVNLLIDSCKPNSQQDAAKFEAVNDPEVSIALAGLSTGAPKESVAAVAVPVPAASSPLFGRPAVHSSAAPVLVAEETPAETLAKMV